MSVDYSSDALIANVKRRAMTPTSQGLYENTDFCALLTDEMQSYIVPLIIGVKEDYFLNYKDYAIDGETKSFEIPDRAIGETLEGVEFFNSGSNTHGNPSRQDMLGLGSPLNFVDCGGYFIRDNHVVFNEAPTNTQDVLRMHFPRRPSNIVPTNQAGRVTGIDTVTKTVSLSYAPTTWTTSTLFDFIRGKGGFTTLGDDKSVTAINGFDLTFTDDLPAGLAIGDWVSENGESPVAQIPYEAHHLLCQAVAIKLQEGMSDANMIKFAEEKLKKLETAFLKVIKSRVATQPKKIVNRKGIFAYTQARNNRY